MGRRTYGQYCGVAHALELVGERWALLVIRDLITGPKRFTDLQRGMPRIPTNVLSARLKELESSGVIAREFQPQPSRSVVYQLTDYGRELEPVVRCLMAWGMKTLGEPRDEDVVNSSTVTIGLQLAFFPAAARGVRAVYEVHVHDAVVQLEVEDGHLSATEGAADNPDLVIRSDTRLGKLLTGEIDPDKAKRSGLVLLEGDEALFEPFVAMFRPDLGAPAALDAAKP